MARTEWVEQRLLNWARWRVGKGDGPLGFAAVRLEGAVVEGGRRDPYMAAPVPTNAIEASETDDAIMRLPSELRATVLEFYLGPGGEPQHLARLVCSRATLFRRLDQADRLLAEHFTARADRARAERARVEELQRDSSRRARGEFYT
jgi:hypothetical protein